MRPTIKLIPDFILPHLERQTYGRHLIWEDEKEGSFKISRIHQSSELWSDDCIGVYKAWSLEKKLWKSDDDKRITKAKHRLITALRRSPVIEVMKKESAYYRFRFIHSKKSANERKRALLELKSNTDFNMDSIQIATTNDDKPPKVKELYITVIDKTENNESVSNVPSHELQNESKDEELSTPSDLSDEIIPTVNNSEDNFWYTSKCCCDILLDSTLLPNENCIWHGIYS
ncbi:IRF tryptophan pentad repeat domain-containing protein [Caerostris extrusa]|uniref:IRF tryptophan pentad repeat domain-containing protein n=1 Tax=Caerostris extrusa TaxID=172846 RepID=A0AAV4TFW5_CAEEX|nr:IRF tryptophan pentad repeat domain-containing protein [Caerostris extrusa]